MSSESVARSTTFRSVFVRRGSYSTRKSPAASLATLWLITFPFAVKVIGLSGAKPLPLSRALLSLK